MDRCIPLNCWVVFIIVYETRDGRSNERFSGASCEEECVVVYFLGFFNVRVTVSLLSLVNVLRHSISERVRWKGRYLYMDSIPNDAHGQTGDFEALEHQSDLSIEGFIKWCRSVFGYCKRLLKHCYGSGEKGNECQTRDQNHLDMNVRNDQTGSQGRRSNAVV